jgi:hypothetical protein
VSDGRSAPGRLEGRAVFLSASVPAPESAEHYRRVADAHLEIEEAVISLARAVFSEGGTLVFGGHPAISPLVAMVAGEYLRPRAGAGTARGEPPIHIYQSRIFEGHLPQETPAMFRAGYARLHWTEAVDGERYDPDLPRDRPRYPASLRHMRETMIGESRPAAMVCIGGMEGVEQEVEIFARLRPAAPIYTFAETGGAAALLAEARAGSVRAIDREVLARLAEVRGRPVASATSVVPYPLIAQRLVAELAHSRTAAREGSREAAAAASPAASATPPAAGDAPPAAGDVKPAAGDERKTSRRGNNDHGR